MANLINRQADFFELFVRGIEFPLASIKVINTCLSNNRLFLADRLAEIDRIKHEADIFFKKVYELTEKYFITPLEKGDILDIFNNICRINNHINHTSHLLHIFNAKDFAREILDYFYLINSSCDMLGQALAGLRKQKNNLIMDVIHKTERLSLEGEGFYLQLTDKLFNSNISVAVSFKYMMIFDSIRDALGSCRELLILIKKIMAVRI